jgi:hypothetical protein
MYSAQNAADDQETRMLFTPPDRRAHPDPTGAHSGTPRRAASLAACCALLAVLSACGSSDQPETVGGAAGPAGVTGSASVAPTTSSAPSPTPPRWAGTTQTLAIKAARTTGGVTYLQVRPAKKKGAWIEVELSEDAENDPKRGKTGDAPQLLAALDERTSGERNTGFDLTFDQQGKVTRATWLYVSAREAAAANIAKWSGSTQFLQIQSAREQDGITYLKVRPAEKEYLGESFETVTTGGPWTEVVMSALAENVPLRGIGGDDGQLRAQLAERTQSDLEEGFDITFLSQGQVSKVTWLYAM